MTKFLYDSRSNVLIPLFPEYIQDHISENNASDFYSESCFGIVFLEIESLKSYQDKLNGYDFSEIPLNHHGPFLDLEDNGMKAFPLQSSGNFVTNYLVFIAWDALLINSMRKCFRVDGDPMLAFLFFSHFKRKPAIQFRRHRI